MLLQKERSGDRQRRALNHVCGASARSEREHQEAEQIIASPRTVAGELCPIRIPILDRLRGEAW